MRLSRLFLAAALLAALSLGCGREPRRGRSLEEDQTRPAAAWLTEEPVRLLHDYVRLDTSEEKGEKEGAEFLQRFFDCAGIESEIVCPAPNRCNLLARLPGRRREGGLLLLNHIDVAPAYAPYWKEGGPFEGKIKNGYLYGRGAYDMKSLALAQALAMRHLKRNGIVPRSDLLFLAEADEESGQRWGSRWLLDRRPEWFENVAHVLNEGGNNEMILRDVRFWGLETVQTGHAFAELEAETSEPLKDLARRWDSTDGPTVPPHPHVVIGFNMLANHLVSPLTDPLRHLERVRGNPAELSILPDRYGSFLEPRIHWLDPYPYPPGAAGRFRTFVLVSVPPGMDPQPYLQKTLAAIPAGVRVVRSQSSGPTTASRYPTPFTDLIERVTHAYFPGVPFGPLPVFGGYTTSVIFRQEGFPTYGYSPIGMNIFDAVRRHGNDERIFLRDFLSGIELYEDVLEEWAFGFGLPKSVAPERGEAPKSGGPSSED